MLQGQAADLGSLQDQDAGSVRFLGYNAESGWWIMKFAVLGCRVMPAA